MQYENGSRDVTLRQHTQDDIPFMQALYRATREHELALTNFSSEQKAAFADQQFSAQYRHYTHHYCTDAFNIVEVEGKRAGRFFVDYWDNQIRVVDIALTEEHRNAGLGTYLFNQLFDEARVAGLPVTIDVEQNNRARRLYERLGFVLKSQPDDIYLLMEWRPLASIQSSAF